MDMNCVALSGRMASLLTYKNESKNVAEFTFVLTEMNKEEVWLTVTVFGKSIQTLEKWGRKGKPLFIKGRLGNSGKNTNVILETYNFIEYGNSKKQTNNEEKVEGDTF